MVGALSAIVLLELIVCSLADGLDAARHFLLFYALNDVLLIITICLAAKAVRSSVIWRPYFSSRKFPAKSASIPEE